MKPNQKGWLNAYLESRKDLHKDLTADAGKKSSHPEHSLYRIIQPTGLMYGQSVAATDLPELQQWKEKERMKILLTESLISSSLLFYDKPVHTEEQASEVILKTLESIGNFYNNIFPELATSSTTLFGRKKSPVELAEKILDKRIDYTGEFEDNFWSYFFHNSLLFLDVFIFGQWIHTNSDRIVDDFFRYEREELRFSVVKVIAAAAHANKVIAYEEKKLFEYFLKSTDITSEKRKESLKIFEEGIDITNINLPSENSWILKKFFLEIAILTVWADKKVEQIELEFVQDFCKYLGFTSDDLDNSMIAIEGFVLEHWEKLEFLQSKQDYNMLSAEFIKRVAQIIEKNKGRLLKEIEANAIIHPLLQKARANELNAEEKEKMRYALIDSIKMIPTFSIVSLPHKFLTLPILLKILPPNIFAEV